MEKKKHKAADVESRRLTAYLLGLVLALTILFVALEYRSPAPDDYEIDTSLLDDLMAEMEFAPVRMEERIPLINIEQPQESEKMVIGDDAEIDAEDVVDEFSDTTWTDTRDVVAAEEVEESTTVAPQYITEIDGEVFRVVRDLPQFPGGATELMRWLTKNLKYPEDARKKGIEGEVIAQFIVGTDGSLSDITIVSHPGKSLEREALRVIRKMPAWSPGVDNGQPCRTMVRIPIVFKL